MSPRPKKINVEAAVPITPEVLPTPEVIAEEKPVMKPFVAKNKPFLEIEKYKEGDLNLEIFDSNPAYAYRWRNQNMLGNGRRGIWVTVRRDHPDFAGLRVAVDHNPTENFFRYSDLILCCCRKETAQQKRKANTDKIKKRDAINQAQEEMLIKVSKDTVRQNINTLEKEIEKTESVLAT